MVTTPATPKDPSRDEIYTPPELFEKMAITFDLDVCAPKGGVPWIPAARHYSIEDDGLSQPWTGRVWMNPPYSQTGKWAARFAQHRNGITIVPMSRSQWWGDVWNSDAALVHPVSKPMFKFIKNDQRVNVYMPIVLVAYGDANIEAISRIGRVR